MGRGTFPRDRAFTLLLDASRFGRLAEIHCVGGRAGQPYQSPRVRSGSSPAWCQPVQVERSSTAEFGKPRASGSHAKARAPARNLVSTVNRGPAGGRSPWCLRGPRKEKALASGEQRDKHDPGHGDELEHLRPGVEDTVKDPGPVQDGTAGSDRVAPAARFQLPGAADHVIHLFTAVAVQRSVVTGVNLDDAEAESHHVEAGLGIDQLQVSDRAAGLLHRRAVEVLGGVDDDAFSSESLFGCTDLVLLPGSKFSRKNEIGPFRSIVAMIADPERA